MPSTAKQTRANSHAAVHTPTSTEAGDIVIMWPAASMFAVGFLLCPFAALSPSGRNLTALLPELRDLLGSLYRHCRDEFFELASTRRWRP
ncbi:hypothetical protein BAE44_0025764 [Dichanthelium oligosanthes]|uniref:Uncharacterized protein n=1 Tax=Dichanthelium oligosanthes TaxID=888268 RepID=A0A1E5UK02_9POAL|nr:hypothetical protein BAE44_0025764 [Dichanthelium oligosanthes]